VIFYQNMQLKFELILTYTKAAMDNWRNFYFSNSSHLEWRAGLLDTILKGTHPARFGLIWFSSFWGEDLNVIIYQICLICIIGINRLKEKFHRKTRNIC
jgi:hypothetical protein